MKALEMKRIGIWIRVSTEDQVRGESPETHERRARGYAEAKEWEIVEVYRLDAVSGKTVIEHPEAKRMLQDIRSGHITGLIFSKLARLSRNNIELLQISEIFRDCGADLISLGESIDTSTPAGRLFYNIISSMAQWEREEIASRVAASVPIRAKMGRRTGGAAAFGYHWVEGKLIPHPEEAPVRKLMYELFMECRRIRTVAKTLNERGYRTRNGSEFTGTTVERLIKDPTAKGYRIANYTKRDPTKGGAWMTKDKSEWVEQPIPAIIPEELWDACNDFIAGRKQTGRRQTRRVTHLFSGLIHCRCGERMYVLGKGPKYICPKCRNKIPIDDMGAIFEEELKNFAISPKELSAHLEKGKATLQEKQTLIEALQKEGQKIAGEIERLHDLYQSGEIDKKGFGAKYGKLAERRDQLENELPQVEAERDVLKIALLSEEDVFSEAKTLYTRWKSLGMEEQRKIVETIVDRIDIHEDEVEIRLLYTPTLKKGATSPNSSNLNLFSGKEGKRATLEQGFIAAPSMHRDG